MQKLTRHDLLWLDLHAPVHIMPCATSSHLLQSERVITGTLLYRSLSGKGLSANHLNDLHR